MTVKGYAPQTDEKVALVNRFKEMEERLLREIDMLVVTTEVRNELRDGFTFRVETKNDPSGMSADQRWLSIARTHFQEGFMALNRSVFQPQRIRLPEDAE